ncbi:MAG: 16S rRNA (guanine(527)-N(7))-methyltransferase RsmG [Rhodocyclaceae bacterium]|jgi:16S rRNA (guanine527-N7)-methyltransferase|nr:16S rRNA (guanine(527)-N(7))-methyltransferase RsmG [Rhodocyclaceae bacterium]MBK6908790.1 16S rRNA (guanine(527)-N(7))-methyltransferase RsmG [Rhodocyclaceae bacterium]
MTAAPVDVVGVLETPLAEGLRELGLDLGLAVQRQLLAYLGLMVRWNRTYNLTAIRDPREMLVQHLFDCLAVLADVRKSALAGRRLRIADVGSGAGLPGIPWAIVESTWSIVTIEAVEKKAAFQRQAKIEIGIRNLEVLSQRVETLEAIPCDYVVSRAFASISDFVAASGHLVADGGHLLAMKGVRPDPEIQALSADWVVEDVRRIAVPMLDAQRHIVILRKN